MDLNTENTTGGSFGLSPILNTLMSLSNDRNKPRWDTYLINIMTLIRNNQQKNKPMKTLINDTIEDAEILISHIVSYVEIDKLHLVDPKIIIYIPFYQLPQLYARKISPQILEQMTACEQIKKLLLPRSYTQGSLNIYIVHVGHTKLLPKQALLSYLESIDKSLKYKRTLLISHIPIDFHIIKNIVELHLMECFTGKLKSSKEFNQKVFHTDVLPFISHLHLLLGDSIFIKRNINKKQYDSLLAIAKKDTWRFKPEILIKKDIESLNIQNKAFFDFEL